MFRTGTLQARMAEAWCSGRGHFRSKRPRPGVPGRGPYRPERLSIGVPGRGHYRPGFTARLPTGWHRRRLIFLSDTPQIMRCCSGSPVLFFAVVAFVVCRRRRVIFLRGTVYDGRKGQAFQRPSPGGAHHVIVQSKRKQTYLSRRAQLSLRCLGQCSLATTPNSRRTPR